VTTVTRRPLKPPHTGLTLRNPGDAADLSNRRETTYASVRSKSGKLQAVAASPARPIVPQFWNFSPIVCLPPLASRDVYCAVLSIKQLSGKKSN
jgi:hypothetical protein